MNEFVHTFCLKKLLPSEEFDSVLLKRDDLFFLRRRRNEVGA